MLLFNISVTCDSLEDISGGNLTLVTNGSHTTVAIECDVGSIFTVLLFNISVTCDSLDDISSGNLTLVTNGSHTTVAIECDLGSIFTMLLFNISVTCDLPCFSSIFQ